ncbi:MAG: TIGR01777 family protein [Lentisphaerae bacterium]|nr:TIGR01777 family protein [Lentisphaerota bacterium]
MKTLITGASGLVGSALVAQLRQSGHEVVRLVRRPSAEGDAFAWDPRNGTMDDRAFDGVEGVVHLAGAPIAAQRWTDQVKQEILVSRVQGTRTLAEAVARLPQPPRVLISASGVGFYGSCGDEVVNEERPAGSGFLAEVAQQWEQATVPASAAGIRVVTMRLGVILSPAGGALPRMLLPFRFGAGGPVGSGNQFMSWITLDDVVSSVQAMLEKDALVGPVNMVAPEPVTSREFARTLGRVLHRPSLLPLPSFAIRLLMGEMGEELLLASTRAIPDKLLASGYAFHHPDLVQALGALLDRR